MTINQLPFNKLFVNAAGELHATVRRPDAFPCPSCGVPVRYATYETDSGERVRYLQDISQQRNHRKRGVLQCSASNVERYREQLANLSSATAEEETNSKGENQ